MPFSRAHYRFVSPREDTPVDVARRFAELVWRRAAYEDMLRAFPTVTPENFEEATEFQRTRERELLRAVGFA